MTQASANSSNFKSKPSLKPMIHSGSRPTVAPLHAYLSSGESFDPNSQIADSIVDLIGHTPIVRLQKLNEGHNILCKVEAMEPANSVKDRIGRNMIEAAEKRGEIKPGDLLIEPTSGNTGIALAMVAAAKGYKLILTMPETMSMERRVMLMAYGAEVLLTPGSKGMNGAIALAKRLCKEKNGKMLQQFDNPDNPEVHYKTTGPEIWR